MSEPRFLQGGGEMGALIRAFDWSGNMLGAALTWPQSLKTATSILLESHFGMYIAWGPDFIELYNDPYRPILGSTKHPAIGQRAEETFAESWHIIGPLFGQVMSGQAIGAEDWMLPLDRHGFLEECFFTFSYSPIRDESGNVGGVLVTVTETTRRVLGERRLLTLRNLAARASTAATEAGAWLGANEALAAAAADLPFVGLYAIDREGGTATLAGRSPVGVSDHVLPALITHASSQNGWPVLEVAATTPVVVSDIRARLGDVVGSAWPEPVHTAVLVPISRPNLAHPYGVLVAGISPRRVYDDAYRDFLVLAADHIATAIANARAHEDERRRAEALAEIDRAKTAFFSNVSHEFRTPLTLMLSPTEEALAGPDRALVGEDLVTVHRNELRLLKLVNTLLDFARIEAGRADASYEPTDLAELTADLASAFRSAVARAGLAFDVRCPPLSEPVFVDRDMWEKIVLNLISNALKFTFEGSIQVSLREASGQVTLEVRDSGVGIPASELPSLFKRFHRVQGGRARTHEGSGIGLALVDELVKMHGGRLEVSSEVHKGSTFRVSVPMGRAHLAAERIRATPTGASTATGARPFVEEALRWFPSAPHGDPAEPAPARVGNRSTPDAAARIVLADDNADMRDYVSRLLGDRWSMRAVGDGLTALAAVRDVRPALVIADVMMPGLDGFELLRHLRSDPQTKDIPVIMLSARAGEEARIDALQAGADDYLVKPFSARELRARVEAQILRGTIRRVEEAHSRRLADVFRFAPVGIAILRGPDHVFEFANEPYLSLVGDRTLVGKTIREALPDLRAQGFYELLDSVYASGQPFSTASMRAVLDRGPGGSPEEGFFKFVYQPMVDSDGVVDGIAIVAIEVTDLAIARRQAEAASLAKDEFIAMLSHELRNPLSPILTALQLMRLRGVDANERERTIIERQVKHLVGLVDDLLDVSRITSGKVTLDKSPLELAPLVARAVEMTSPLLEERQHTLDVRVARHGLSVEADARRFEQVLCNVLSNAAKYTDPGGHISVKAVREGDTVVISIRDSGIGVEPDMLSTIFDVFTQARQSLDRSRGGLGLGLAIVRSLVDLHGGTVHVTSPGRGRGTTVSIRLPFAAMAADAGPADVPAPAAGPPRRSGARVLVVDDNKDSAEMFAASLAALGHETRVALDGPDALAVARAFQPQLALLDIGLPVMDGYELGRRLRGAPETRDVGLVALTGYGQERDRAASEAAGFDAHLVKPVDLEELARLVETLTERPRTSSPGSG